jgi:hypothetical protein
MVFLGLMAALLAMQPGELQGAHFPFVSTRMVSVVTLAGGRVSCRTTFQGQEVRDPGGNDCSIIADNRAEQSLRAIGGDAALTMVIGFDPEGAPPHPEDGADRGEMIAEASISYEVNAAGDIINCRQLANRILRRMQYMADPPDLCEFPLLQRGAFQAARGPGLRRGAAHIRIYLRSARGAV